MSQNDFVIDNASFPATRADLTSAFRASASNSSGSTSPATTYANMFWYDTSANVLKMRSEANDAWISIGYLDQTANEFNLLDDTKLVDTSGTQTGLLGDQATSDWQAATSTVESLVSPAKVSAAVAALVPAASSSIGVGQSWSTYARNRGTLYQNVTGRAIEVHVVLSTTSVTVSGGGNDTTYSGSAEFTIAAEGGATLSMASSSGSSKQSSSVILPDNYYYKWAGNDGGNPNGDTLAFATFTELR